MTLLEARCVSKYFGGLTALSDISFAVGKGEILGVIGPNGAGKTTLFNVVNGFYRPSKGDVFFKGQPITGLKPHKICRAGVARTFQVVKPLQRMTVFDNVMTSSFLRAPTRAEAEKATIEVLEATGLSDDRDVVSKSLPLGKRKRLEIARALATGPELILVDEAFAGLNPTEINEQIGIVRAIRERGIAMLVIEHHMKVIMSVSDRILVLNYGAKIAEGAPDVVSRDPVVIEAYLGEEDA